jgi:hypothetical protein
MNQYCLKYSEIKFARPSLSAVAVSICKLALNEANLSIPMRTIRSALGIHQKLLKKKWSSLVTDNHKLNFPSEARLGIKFTSALIHLVAKGILVPCVKDDRALVFSKADGIYVQKWKISDAIGTDREETYLNLFLKAVSSKCDKNGCYFPPWGGNRSYRFLVAHTSGPKHEKVEEITRPEWTDDDLNDIELREFSHSVFKMETLMLAPGSVYFIGEVCWAYLCRILKLRLMPTNQLDNEIKPLMASLVADCEARLDPCKESLHEDFVEEIEIDEKVNVLPYYNGSYSCPSPHQKVILLDIVIDTFSNLRKYITYKFIESEATPGYKELLIKNRRYIVKEPININKALLREVSHDYASKSEFLLNYSVKGGKSDTVARSKEISWLSSKKRDRYPECDYYMDFALMTEDTEEDLESEEVDIEETDKHNLFTPNIITKDKPEAQKPIENKKEDNKHSITILDGSRKQQSWDGVSLGRNIKKRDTNHRLTLLKTAVSETLTNKKIIGKKREMNSITQLYKSKGLVKTEEAMEQATEGRIITISKEDYDKEENKLFVKLIEENDDLSISDDLLIFNTCLIPDEDYDQMQQIIDILASIFEINILLISTDETTAVKNTKFTENRLDFTFLLLVMQFFSDLVKGTSSFNKFVSNEPKNKKKFEMLNAHFVEIIRKIKIGSNIKIKFPLRNIGGYKKLSDWANNRTMRLWYRLTGLMDIISKPHRDTMKGNVERVENKFPRKFKNKVNRINIKVIDETLTPAALALIIGKGESHIASLILKYIHLATGDETSAEKLNKFGKLFTEKYKKYSDLRDDETKESLIADCYKIKRLFYKTEGDTVGYKIYKAIRRIAYDRKQARRAREKVIIKQNRKATENETGDACIKRVLGLHINASDAIVQEKMKLIDRSIFNFAKYRNDSYFPKVQVWHLESLIAVWEKMPYGSLANTRNGVLNILSELFLSNESFRDVGSIEKNIRIKVYSIGRLNGLFKQWRTKPQDVHSILGALYELSHDQDGLMFQAILGWYNQIGHMDRVTAAKDKQSVAYKDMVDHMVTCGFIKDSSRQFFQRD